MAARQDVVTRPAGGQPVEAGEPGAASPAPAGASVPVVAPAVSPHDPRHARPRSCYRQPDGTILRDLGPVELLRAVQGGEGVLWVDIDTTSRSQHALLEKVFGFHPLSIEDTLNPASRVKLEEYPGYLFAIVRGVGFCDTTEDPYDLETANLCLFVGRNFLVTVHEEHAPAVEFLADRIGVHADFMARGPAWLAYLVCDAAVDGYFPILDRVDEFVDGLEERVFTSFDEAALQEIFSVKRLVLTLRRHLVPQREIFNVLTNRPSAMLTADSQVYFRDVYDHVLRINDTLDMYRDLLGSTMDSYLSQVSNRVGQVTKGLSLVATLSIPFVMVSGMWGMNFTRIPLADHPYGFAIMLVLQLAMGVALVLLLKWRKLL